MAKYIHNVSAETKEYQGREILTGAFYKIPSPLYAEYSEDQQLIEDIQNGVVVMSRDGVNDIENVENSLLLLSTVEFRCSVAIDKNSINQFIQGTNPIVVSADRILWDIGEDYDLAAEDFVVPADGVYYFDSQIRVTNLANVSSIELALYKRGEPDDYWFILDKQAVGGQTEIQLNGATEFDFYKDERYALKVIMYKTLPLVDCSCTISGDDDYTAWGYTLRYLF